VTQRERRFSFGLALTALGAVIFLFIISSNVIEFHGVDELIPLPDKIAVVVKVDPNADIEPQKQLIAVPQYIKAIYATNWSAGSAKKVEYFFDLLNTTELNAIVIDIKDYTGVVGYEPLTQELKEKTTWEKRIPRINALIKRLHDSGIYVIGRIAVFQDGALVKTRPDLALRSKATGAVWGDRKNVHWLDTASEDVWNYNAEIANDALARGFDEINFDYIRFASDGNISDIVYPFYDRITPKGDVLHKFFVHMRNLLPDAKLSADFFGEATYTDESGIGQRMKDVFGEFDFIAPMIYPSHYANGFNGYANPANAPYEVVHYSMEQAIAKAMRYATTAPTSTPLRATYRPWLQDFNLGTIYTADMVRAQIQALDDLSGTSTTPLISGWMLWNASNVYTKSALLPQ
jgi:hypothetical protein